MGTRADFYIERDKTLEWCGSVCWDGYDVVHSSIEDKNNPSFVKYATTEEDYLEAISNYSKERIEMSSDWISPSEGWPWPWDNSHNTDCSYVFRNGKVDCYEWGRLINENDDDGEILKDNRFPDMSSIKNVKDAGFIIISCME